MTANYYNTTISLSSLKHGALFYNHVIPLKDMLQRVSHLSHLITLNGVLSDENDTGSLAVADELIREEESDFELLRHDLLPEHLLNDRSFMGELDNINRNVVWAILHYALKSIGQGASLPKSPLESEAARSLIETLQPLLFGETSPRSLPAKDDATAPKRRVRPLHVSLQVSRFIRKYKLGALPVDVDALTVSSSTTGKDIGVQISSIRVIDVSAATWRQILEFRRDHKSREKLRRFRYFFMTTTQESRWHS
jgi:hypothetical protein